MVGGEYSRMDGKMVENSENPRRGCLNSLNKGRRAIFFTFLAIGLAGLLLLSLFMIFPRNSEEFSEINQKDSEKLNEIRNRALIEELRTTNLKDFSDGTNLFSYNPKIKEILVEDEDSQLIIKMKLVSPYVVSGLIAGRDIKVAEFFLEDWEDKRTNLIDAVNFYNVGKDYEPMEKDIWFKYGVDNEFCDFDICFNHTQWFEFETLGELPHKNIKIGMFTDTTSFENVEWVPTIKGFEVLQWAEWDVSTASEVGEFDSSSEMDIARSIFLKPDGTKMYLGGSGGSPNWPIAEYNLTIPWNVSTAIYSALYTVTTDYPTGLFFSSDGLYFYIVGGGGTDVDQFKMSEPWLVNTSALTPQESLNLGASSEGIYFDPDGFRMVHFDTTGTADSYTLSEKWNVSTALQKSTKGYAGNNPRGMSMKSDGTKLYGVYAGSKAISENNITTAWNVSTGIYSQNITLGYSPYNVFFSLSGTRMFVTDTTNDKIIQYSLPASAPAPAATTTTLNSPIDGLNTTNFTINFNCSATSNVTIMNLSLYIDNLLNYTIADGIDNETNISIEIPMTLGNHTWNCLAYDSENVSDWGDTNRTLNISYINENSQTFNSPALTRSSQMFSLNLSYDSTTFTNIQAILNYNNTEYSGIRTGIGNKAIFNKTIITPPISTKTNFTFYWEIILTGDTEYKINTTFQNQTVNPITIDDCSSNAIELYNFTIVNERTQNKLGGVAMNTSAKINIELYTSNRLSLISNYSQNFTKTNPFRICLNSSLSNGETYNLDAQIQYTAQGFVKEYYHIQSETISSSSLAQNITLYSLDNITSTTFEIIYKDNNFLPLSNALVQIQRKYVDEGVFKTVELPKTDTNGETIAHLEEEDVVYKFIVIKNGVIQATFTDFLVKCEDPVLGTCEINLNAFKSSLEPSTFINLDDFAFTLTYNKTTRTVQSIYTVPSGSSATVSLNTTLADGLGTTVVCSDRLTSASGTLSCVVPTSFGNTTIITELVKDGKIVGRGMLAIQESPASLYGTNLMFLGFFLMITLVGVGLGSSPMVSGIFLIFGAIIGISFNLVSNTGFIGYSATILWLIIAIVIIIMKGAKRE